MSAPAVRPASLALFWGGLAATYSLLPLASGLHIALSVADLIAATAVWTLLGLGAGAMFHRKIGDHDARPVFRWALAAAIWAGSEALYMVIVVAKPTRWPPLFYTVFGIIVPGIVAASIAFRALRRASRESRLGRAHPAVVIIASWASYAAVLLWSPRWLRAFAEQPRLGWIWWGAVDLLWIASSALCVTAAGGALLATGPRRVRRIAITLALAALQIMPQLAGRTHAHGTAAPDSPDIVWILVDSVRTDHVGSYGYGRATMPTFDRLAREGTLIRNQVSAGVRTENTYAKVLPLREGLDGYEPAKPGPLSAARNLLPAQWVPLQPGLVTSMQERGYETALFHTYYDLLEDRGLQPWLDSFEHAFVTRLSGDASMGAYVARIALGEHLDGLPRMDRWALLRRCYYAEHISKDAIRFLADRKSRRPLFLVIHLAGGHEPFYVFDDAPRVGTDPRLPVEASHYDDSLRSADDQLKDLVAAVRDHLPRAFVFVFADHGTMFDGAARAPALLNVPLVVVPALTPSLTSPETVTSSQDIAATTLDLAEDAPPRCDSPLARDLRCPPDPANVRVVDHTGHGQFFLAAVVDHQLTSIDLTHADPVAAAVSSLQLDVCSIARRLQLRAIVPSPIEGSAGLGARLAKLLDLCGLKVSSAR